MHTDTTTEAPGLRLTPLDWDGTRAVLLPKFKDRAHWIFVAHFKAMGLISEIERRYYLGHRNRDFTLVTIPWRGQTYVLCAFHKRQMRDYQLTSILRRWTSAKLRDAELQTRDLFISAPSEETENNATQLAAYVFNGRELALGA